MIKLDESNKFQLFLVSVATIIIIFAVVISFTVIDSSKEEKQFAKIVTVGPLWTTDSWSCTSDSDFMLFGTLRSVDESFLSISIPDLGTQSLYSLDPGKLETFSIGANSGNEIIITRTGIVTGFITIETDSGAEASCEQIP